MAADCLLSAFLAIVAAALLAMNESRAGLWLFEVSLLLAVYGSLRLLWLPGALVRIVASDDADVLEPADVNVPSDQVARTVPRR